MIYWNKSNKIIKINNKLKYNLIKKRKPIKKIILLLK